MLGTKACYRWNICRRVAGKSGTLAGEETFRKMDESIDACLLLYAYEQSL